jgi:Zn2+/Cd2+-exporting ATPase
MESKQLPVNSPERPDPQWRGKPLAIPVRVAPPPPAATAADDCCATGTCVAPPPAAAMAGQRFRIPTMCCPVEENEIRRALEPLAGVRKLDFQLTTRTLAIDAAEGALPAALDAIRKAGFTPEPLSPAEEHTPPPAFGTGLARLVLALAFAVFAEALHLVAPEGGPWSWLGMAIALAAIALSGLDVYRKGLGALRDKRLNINALMSVAVTGAFLIGQWPEAAMVMALYAVAELIEARAVDRARNAIAGLLALAPEHATVQVAGGWQQRPVAEVMIGSIVRLRPGERLPLDGTVTRGKSAVDQAAITGESLPVDKGPGDPVFAGTINANGELEFRVTAAAGNTTLARIIHAVEQAQGSRAPTQRIVDRFSEVYTPAVFMLAVAVALLLPLLTGAAWLAALYKALVLLVIACPCALVISTPVTVVSGLAAAARRGILFKGGAYLESARGLKVVAFDKTGTLTEGKPRLVHWQRWQGADEVQASRVAASLAARSDHPVSQAIAAAVDGERLPVQAFRALPGRGAEGNVAGQDWLLGNHRVLHERGWCDASLEAALSEQEALGRSVTLLASEGRVHAFFAVADTLRPSSRDAVAQLRALGIAPVLLSGDNTATARAIAADAGISDVRGELLPEDKLRAIEELQRLHGATAMAGDGINDAPALARADVGFAMGAAGTGVAMEAADVVVMNDDLRRIAESVRLSRRTYAVLWQNIVLAVGVKAVFLLLAIFGSATMWMAVFADMGTALLVVFNGLRMLAGVRPFTTARG